MKMVDWTLVQHYWRVKRAQNHDYLGSQLHGFWIMWNHWSSTMLYYATVIVRKKLHACIKLWMRKWLRSGFQSQVSIYLDDSESFAHFYQFMICNELFEIIPRNFWESVMRACFPCSRFRPRFILIFVGRFLAHSSFFSRIFPKSSCSKVRLRFCNTIFSSVEFS